MERNPERDVALAFKMFVRAGFAWKNSEKLLTKYIIHNIMWSLEKVNINVVVLKKKLRFYLIVLDLFLACFYSKILLNSMTHVLHGNVRSFY